MGRLNLTTPADVVAFTLIEDLKSASTDVLTRFVDEAEGYIARYGEFDTAKAGYAEDMKTAANMLVERLYLRADPDFLRGQVQGITELAAGSYMQKNGVPEALPGEAVAAILNFYCTLRY